MATLEYKDQVKMSIFNSYVLVLRNIHHVCSCLQTQKGLYNKL